MAHSSSSDTSFRPYSMSIFGPPAHCAPQGRLFVSHTIIFVRPRSQGQTPVGSHMARRMQQQSERQQAHRHEARPAPDQRPSALRAPHGLTSMAVAEASCMRSAQLILGYFSLIGFSHPTALSRP